MANKARIFLVDYYAIIRSGLWALHPLLAEWWSSWQVPVSFDASQPPEI